MLGNDLIYSPQWPRRTGSRGRRFRQKVFTDREQRCLLSRDSFLPEIILWSAKEAVYKAHLRQGGERGFYPLQVALHHFVHFNKALFFAPSGKYYCQWQRYGAYWYCWAQALTESSSPPVQHWLGYLPKGEEHTALPLALKNYQIVKNTRGIPFLKEKPQWPFSKTHAGGVTAITWKPTCANF